MPPLFHESIGAGPPLLVLHGLFGSGDNWRTVLKPLAEHYQVVFVDQRNHGRSFHADVHTIRAMAEDVRELVQHYGWDAVTLLGHSMGGKTAMAYALTWPTEVRALVVVDMGIRAYRPHHDAVLAGLQAVDLSTITTRQEAEAALALHIAEASTRQFLLKSLMRLEAGGFGWKFNLSVLARDYVNILESLEWPGKQYAGPTLFLHGGESGYVKDTDLPAIRAHFPQAVLESVPGAGHWVHADKPAEFVAAVQRFLGA
jgi:esterase